ncbi:hypothetical protein [Thermococcus sp.]|uniref:hypothetical protein n=1 Tax=Thermococcus sp. TaxID=35749 RepID=UPI0025F68324|nr:hypothetical protein [Thermococcus sp.]
MVYYEHATNPVVFGTLLTVYYSAMIIAVVAWFWSSYQYIQKGNYQLKKLVGFILIAVFLTSLSGARLLDKYLYLHSPINNDFCMTSSCVLSSEGIKTYNLNTTELERLDVPSVGPMWVYPLYDVGPSYSLGINKQIKALVVVRPLLIVPAVEVVVYQFRGTHFTGKQKFYVVWPQSPGNVLSKKLDFHFTVLIIKGGGGGGGGAA